MSPHRSDRFTKAAGVVAVALIATGCSTHTDPGLAVRGKEVNVVFGVKARPLVRTTPNAVRGPIPAAPVDFGAGGFVGLPPSFPDIDLPPLVGRRPINEDKCPAALENAIVKKRADANIPFKLRPGPGTEAWTVTGTVDGKALKRGFEERQLADVNEELNTPDNTGVNEKPEETGQAFSWTTTEPEVGGGFVRRTFKIKSLSHIPQQNVQLFAPVGAPVVGPAPVQPPYRHEERVGAPDRGLVLTNVERFDAQGSSIYRFTPQVGLLLLPLPVGAGQKFTARAVDASSATEQVLVYSAQVTGRQVVDACGELVQGWTVKGLLSNEPRQLSEDEQKVGTPYDLTFATQYGGQLIAERRVEEIEGKVYDRTFSIGLLPRTTTVETG